MDFLRLVLVFLHILGAAAIVGGWLAAFETPTVTQWQWIGALTQLVTGLLLVGLAEMGDGDGPNHFKVAVKLIIALVVVVAAFIGRRKVKNNQDVPKGLAHAVGGMAFINVAVAVFWV
jgi:peptidoglycan/LPS O-acetylase OafA/YrhL